MMPDAASAQPDSRLASPVDASPGAPHIRVLFVEEDQRRRERVSRQLSNFGFVVRSFADGKALLTALGHDTQSDVIVVVDWGLPTWSGLELLVQLRRHPTSLPVVLLSGHPEAAPGKMEYRESAIGLLDRAHGLNTVADRLKRAGGTARLTADPESAKDIVSGKLVLRMDISRAFWNGVDVGLTYCEFRILHLIVSSDGRFVTYRAIYDGMHYKGFVAGSGEDGYRRNVRSAIKRIRNKFRQFDPAFAEIETYIAFGYRWRPAEASLR